jgi:hypothetical protein
MAEPSCDATAARGSAADAGTPDEAVTLAINANAEKILQSIAGSSSQQSLAVERCACNGAGSTSSTTASITLSIFA